MIFTRLCRNAIVPRVRLIRILRVLLVMGMSLVLLRVMKKFMTREAFTTRAQKVHHKNARRLLRTCIRLKGIFVKIGQYLSLRVDVLPDEYIQVLSALQDKVPPIPAWRVIRRIEKELGKPVHELFKSFDAPAIASASLAQVHKAELHDGRIVAVKVLYPGIEKLFLTDLHIVRILVNLARFFTKHLNYSAIVDEFQKHVAFELDMLNEAQNIKIITQKFMDFPRIVVPVVIDSHTSKGVVTTEFIDGIKITDKETYTKAGVSVFDVSRETVDAYMRQIFKYGFFQADPHPGNLFVILDKTGSRDGITAELQSTTRNLKLETRNFSIGIVDFGLCKGLPPKFVSGMTGSAVAIIQRDAKMLAANMLQLGFSPLDGREESLYKFCGFVMAHVEDFIYKKKGDINFVSMIPEILQMAREHPLVNVPADFIFIGRVFALLIGLGKQLGAKIDVAGIVMPYVMDAATQ